VWHVIPPEAKWLVDCWLNLLYSSVMIFDAGKSNGAGKNNRYPRNCRNGTCRLYAVAPGLTNSFPV